MKFKFLMKMSVLMQLMNPYKYFWSIFSFLDFYFLILN